jgi:hypothetical protein
MEGFNNATGIADEERAIFHWDTDRESSFVFPLNESWADGGRIIGIPVKSNRITMLFVDVYLECDIEPSREAASGYKTSFVAEWEGWNTMYFDSASFTAFGSPGGLQCIKRIRLKAGSATFGGTVLDVGTVTWHRDMPPIRNNAYEDILMNFLATRYWNPDDWAVTQNSGLPAKECGLVMEWMYAYLWYLQKPGRTHKVAVTRKMDVDIGPYQAFSIYAAADVRSLFSVVVEIDGAAVRAIDRLGGTGDGDELRVEISGSRLQSVTFELEQAEAEITEQIDVHVATFIRWILLERKGVDPAMTTEVTGIPEVSLPKAPEDRDSGLLPIGIFISREEFLNLREKAKQPGPIAKIAAEIIAEADTHLDYRPEQFVGRYLPVSMSKQGCERKACPSYEMYHYLSCMIYSSLAYALTGDLRYGQSARRALFSTLRCGTWQSGFSSRIPSGLPGYRAPFIESHTSEAVAICYDFIYGILSEEERRDVEDTFYKKAIPWIDMYHRLNGEGYLLTSNQGAVYTSGFVCAALVAHRSHPDVDGLLESRVGWLKRMMGLYFQQDGSSNEGPGYWSYTMCCGAMALVALARYKGWDVRDYAPEHLIRTMDYMMHVKSVAQKELGFFCLGDAIASAGFPYLSGPLMFFAKYYDNENALWLWHEYYAGPNPPASSVFGNVMAFTYATLQLMNFIFFTDGSPASPQLEESKHFTVCDRVTLRTGCEYGDMLFFFEGGPQTFGHTHFDKGQFILEAYGEKLAADPGVIKYQDPAHIFYISTSYHNLVTIGGRDQDYKDADKAVVLEKTVFEKEYDYIQADLSNSYKSLSKYRRRILFVRPYYFLILDDILSTEPGLEWNYHSGVPYEHIDLPSGLINLKGQNAAMTMAVASNCPLKASTATFTSDGEVLTYNLELAQQVKGAELTLAALLLPYPLNPAFGAFVPEVKVAQTADTAVFTVSGPWGLDRVVCRLQTNGGLDAGMPMIQVFRAEGEGERLLF